MAEGGSKRNWVWLLLLVGAICMSGAGAGVFYGAKSFQRFVELRDKERHSADQMQSSIEGFANGRGLGKRPEFPDSPTGKLQAMSYDLMERQLGNQQKFISDLEASGFDWVLSPESLRTAKNLDEALARTKKADDLIERYFSDYFRDIDETLAKMDQVANANPSSRNFVAGIRDSIHSPEGGLNLNRETLAAMRDNHTAIRGILTLLRAHDGQYQVADDGSVTFIADVPDSLLDEYNRHVHATESTMKRLEALDERRIQMMNSALGKMKED